MALLGECRGYTLVELMFYCGVAAAVGLVVSNFATFPTRLMSRMNTVNSQQSGYSATNIPVNDLKSAVAASIAWNLIDPTQSNPPYDPTSNPQYIPWFQVNDPSVPAPGLPISYVCYTYNAAAQTVLREFISGAAPQISTGCVTSASDNAQESVIAQNVLPPTAQEPLFSKDPTATNLVVFTLQFPGSSNTVTTVVRRAYVRS